MIETQYKSGLLRRAAMNMGEDAERAMRAQEARRPPLKMVEARPPHQRAITEHPQIGSGGHRDRGPRQSSALIARIGPRQRRFRLVRRTAAAEIRLRRLLPDFDDRAANRACAREALEQSVAVARANRAGERGEILVEAAEHFEDRLLVVEEDVAPHRRVGGGDAG